MTNNFTPELLVKYIYKETTQEENLAIADALQKDNNLMAEYQELYAAYRELPKVQFRPKKSVVNSILAYSQETALEEQL